MPYDPYYLNYQQQPQQPQFPSALQTAGIPSLIGLGGQAVGGLFNALAGQSWGEKKRRSLYDELYNQRDAKPFSVNNYTSALTNQGTSLIRKLSPGIERKYGTGGAGAGALYGRLFDEWGDNQLSVQRSVDEGNYNAQMQNLRARMGLVG